ncbi:MAG: DUF1801 domain-containing protein [Chitinophagaceae bacterium]
MTDSTIGDYISSQPSAWQAVLTSIHKIIIKQDATVVPVIEKMMGKEMIIYKAKGMMKYALAGGKNYMSLHNLAMYMNQPLLVKYQPLLPEARFQKGCINFTSADEMPEGIISQLIGECAAIDLVKKREDYLLQKKSEAKAKGKSK